ncbi:sensor histidine kinase [Litoribrevibacter euphylliae]|uniref:histidine kinase n=1 Tax=Litoribrevibacter euphylliae TaxID=1834034 RepID=A0ABV7HA35_9GAMM
MQNNKPVPTKNTVAPKTLSQQLRRQVIWAAVAFSIAVIVSIFYINWRSLQFAANEMFILDAQNILQNYLERKVEKQAEPQLEIQTQPSEDQSPKRTLQSAPNSDVYKVYLSLDEMSAELRSVFPNEIEPFEIYEGELMSPNDDGDYLSLFRYDDQGHSIYLLWQYGAEQTEGMISGVIWTLIVNSAWLLLLIFIGLFLFVFWLLKRANEPMVLLSAWAERLKHDDQLSQQTFPIAELNDLAKQLKSGVDRITEYNLREQQFLKHASHELRTPLATIQACLDTLDFKLSGAEQTTVQRALKASLDMSRLSSALLWLARESEVPIEKSPVNLQSFCEKQISDHQYLIANRDVTIEPFVEEISIHIEEDLLVIVFANLLRNACQFTMEGAIRIHLNQDGFSIENPIDVDADHRSSEFRSFGLGLQLVERICQKLDWKFHFQQQVDGVEVIVFW